MEKYLTREKLLGVSHHKHFPIVFVVLFVLLLLDLIFVNYKILSTNPTKIAQSEVITAEKNIDQDSCGKNCQEEINKAVEAAVVPKTASSQTVVNNNSSVQEYFIPLGSGVINSTSWQTIQGMQAYIDGGAYGSNPSVTFEISVSIPTGNETASFMLYDATQNHPVWNSTVTFTGGGTPQTLISSPITLDSGNNLYVVQAQTQLQFPAYITQARVHIITN